MRRSLEPLLVVAGTVLLLGGLARGALEVVPADRPVLDAVVRTPTSGGGGVERGRGPDGGPSDPQTMQLVGWAPASDDGSTPVSWTALGAYAYREGLASLPEDLRALDGRRVTVAGFLLPLYEFDAIREFNLVASHWSCCFGVPPGLSGWVHVKLAPGHDGLRNTTEPLKVTGTLHVAEHMEAGYVVSIYALRDARATVIGWEPHATRPG